MLTQAGMGRFTAGGPGRRACVRDAHTIGARRASRADGQGVNGPVAGACALVAGTAFAWRALVVAALLSPALAMGLHWVLGPPTLSVGAERLTSHPRSGASLHGHGVSALPLTARAPVSETLGAASPAYRIRMVDGGFAAASPTQHFRSRFSAGGLSLSAATVHVGLSLRAVGFGSSLRSLDEVKPRAEANRVSYEHPHLSEWFVNGPLGLEQGFTLTSAPSARAVGALTLSVALEGDTHASLTPGGRSITLSRAGRPVLRYGGLSATDARGRALHSWLELHGGRILLRVDASHARYPLRIDPFLAQGEKLRGGEELGEGAFAIGVALSADGNTALIGGYDDNGGVGAAWAFTRSGEKWTQQGTKLTAKSDEELGAGLFGFSVALSADGNTALIGAPGDNGSVGAAWAFTRSGEKWVQQGTKLTGGGESGEGAFGLSVALSAKEGNTTLIGAPDDGGGVGAAFAFTRSGEKWTQQGTKLTGGEELGEGAFGSGVALSPEGGTALIGGYGDNGDVGAAWAFTRAGEKWVQQGTKIAAKSGEELGPGLFGQSVALGAKEGNTALIGAPDDNGGVGAAWAFTRSGEKWTQQGTKLTAKSGEVGEGLFGQSVALAAKEGNTALIGAPDDNGGVGAAWAFTRSGEKWVQQGAKLTAKSGEEVGPGLLGQSATLSSEGSTALIGAPADNGVVGAAWVFVNAVAAPTYVASITRYEAEGKEVGFSEPTAVAVDQSKNIWVADSAADRIVEFNPERRFLREFGKEGTGEGQFKGISGLATNASGDLYVSDAGNHRIQEFGPSGERLRSFGSLGTGAGQFITPGAIAVDASGDLWALNSFGVQVQEFSSEGKYISGFGSFSGPLLAPTGLAFSGGNLYVTEDGFEAVKELSSTGAVLGQFGSKGAGVGQFYRPSAIACETGTGNLFVTEAGSLVAKFINSPPSFVFEATNNRVQEFTNSGQAIATFGSVGSGAGQFSSPKGLAVSSAGAIYVADTGNKRVQEWVQAP